MKVLSFLIVLFSLNFLNEGENKIVSTVTPTNEDHRSCTCSGFTCTCTISCLDNGETPSCACTAFSCTCTCNVKDLAGPPSVPTMDSNQTANSTALESFTRRIGSNGAIDLANQIKTMRESIGANDGALYHTAGKRAENAFKNLSAAEKQQIENWIAARS
ncbi:MAG: hypothetical protein HUU01_23295 [Saprospiraceae bacterium]|nr:hypothetical protein [Saprospiraceae bacterium]